MFAAIWAESALLGSTCVSMAYAIMCPEKSLHLRQIHAEYSCGINSSTRTKFL